MIWEKCGYVLGFQRWVWNNLWPGVDNILWRRYLSTRELKKERNAEMCRCRETNSPVFAWEYYEDADPVMSASNSKALLCEGYLTGTGRRQAWKTEQNQDIRELRRLQFFSSISKNLNLSLSTWVIGLESSDLEQLTTFGFRTKVFGLKKKKKS